MAEQWTRAFGRYLKTLRERRRLSLNEVSTLSQPFADKVNKGYLSRCENGLQRLGFSKVIPLSRIYEVPADVLLERMELDMELDRVGGALTDGKSFAELTAEARQASNEGYAWIAYGLLRDAIPRAASDPVEPLYRDTIEQTACARMNCSTAAILVGRTRFALYELESLLSGSAIGPRFHPILLERISRCYTGLKEYDWATQYADKAILESEKFGEINFLGYVYANRAHIAVAQSKPNLAAEFYHKAYNAYQGAGRQYESARTLNNLAQAYFDLGRMRAARRILLAAETLMRPLKQHRAIALGRILMGEIEAVDRREHLAVKCWKEAALIAQQINDKTLRFKAEYLLLKHACENGDEPVARAIQRRLSKLSHWVPAETPELESYRQLLVASLSFSSK